MSVMNLPIAARPTMGAMLGSRLTPSSAHISMMAGLSMRRWGLMKLWLKARVSALESAGGGGGRGGEKGGGKKKSQKQQSGKETQSEHGPPLEEVNMGRRGE